MGNIEGQRERLLSLDKICFFKFWSTSKIFWQPRVQRQDWRWKWRKLLEFLESPVKISKLADFYKSNLLRIISSIHMDLVGKKGPLDLPIFLAVPRHIYMLQGPNWQSQSIPLDLWSLTLMRLGDLTWPTKTERERQRHLENTRKERF